MIIEQRMQVKKVISVLGLIGAMKAPLFMNEKYEVGMERENADAICLIVDRDSLRSHVVTNFGEVTGVDIEQSHDFLIIHLGVGYGIDLKIQKNVEVDLERMKGLALRFFESRRGQILVEDEVRKQLPLLVVEKPKETASKPELTQLAASAKPTE